MNTNHYIFLDLETTGLDFMKDQITEAAWIDPWDKEHQYLVLHDKMPNEWVIHNTDYCERILKGHYKVDIGVVLFQIRNNLSSSYQTTTYLVGANPAFDDRFLRKAYADAKLGEPPYHYHLIDIETVVMGKLDLAVPPKLKECRSLLGIEGANPAPHTALADAQEVKLIWDKLQSLKQIEGHATGPDMNPF